MRKLLRNLTLLASTAISPPALAETDSAAAILDASIQTCHEATLSTYKGACLRNAYDAVRANASSKVEDLLGIPTADEYSKFIQQQNSNRLSIECPLFETALEDMPPTELREVSNYFVNIAKGCAEFGDAISVDITTIRNKSQPAPLAKP